MEAMTCNSRQVRTYVIDCMQAGVMPFIKGSPGIGKSAIVKSIADEFNMQLIDQRLSTSAPEDLTGLPRFKEIEYNGQKQMVSEFVPFEMFPTEGTPLPAGKDGWIIFLDELNSATKMVQAASYKLILDKMTGQRRLHERVMLVAAGNKATDRAIVNQIGTAMQSRMITLNMEFNHDIFMQDVVTAYGWDNRVAAYLAFKPSAAYDFRSDNNEDNFCCPRTWEHIHKLIKGKTFDIKTVNNIETYEMEEKTPLYAGTITSGEALSFVQFTKIFHTLPKIRDILSNPTTLDIPHDRALRFAIACFLVDHIKDDTFKLITDYINRFTAEFRVLFFRMAVGKKPEIKDYPEYRKSLVEISRYMNG